jgi:flagellar motor switch protein FliN/FliY
MDDASPSTSSNSGSPFTSVPVEISVCVGKARPLIRDLGSIGENALLPLDKSVSDPVDLYVGNRLIARGMLEEQDGEQAGRLCVRLTEIIHQSPDT